MQQNKIRLSDKIGATIFFVTIFSVIAMGVADTIQQYFYPPTIPKFATLQWNFDPRQTTLQSFTIWLGDTPDSLHSISMPPHTCIDNCIELDTSIPAWDQRILVNQDHLFFKVTAIGFYDPPENKVARMMKTVPLSITSSLPSIILHSLVEAQAVTQADSYQLDSPVEEYERPTPIPYINPCYQSNCETPTPSPNANNRRSRTTVAPNRKVRPQP